jgi:predicted metal-dependent hydrolase
MNCISIIEKILEEYKQKLGINDAIKVKIKRYKTKTAFTNLKTRTIYVNRDMLDLGEDVIKYLILHELIHIKLNNKYHDHEFFKILYEYISPEELTKVRSLVNERFIDKSHQLKTKEIK